MFTINFNKKKCNIFWTSKNIKVLVKINFTLIVYLDKNKIT